MADTEPNWEWYRSFVAVLETGSLSAAGRAMGMTQPTVGATSTASSPRCS